MDKEGMQFPMRKSKSNDVGLARGKPITLSHPNLLLSKKNVFSGTPAATRQSATENELLWL